MFKENRLIFEFEQPKESGSNLPSQESDKTHEGPESPFAFLAKAFGSLEDLEKLAEKHLKINAVFDQFKPFLEKENGLLHFIDLKKTTKLNKQQNDALFKAFEEEALKALIAEQIEAGYEFVKFNNNGLSWTWRDPVGNLITRINPLFQSKDIHPVLNNEITDQLEKLHEELINKDLETILQKLVSNGSVAKTLPMEYLKTTDFARDICEALRIVHSLPAGHGYILDITKEGEVNFLLEDESLKNEGYKDLSYNVKDYDQYLNQPKKTIETAEQEKSPSEEPAVAYEVIDEKPPKTFEEVKNEGLLRMDALAEEYPKLQEVNTGFKEWLTAIEPAIQEEIKRGTGPLDVMQEIVTNRPDLREKFSQLTETWNIITSSGIKTDREQHVEREFSDLIANLIRGTIESYGIPTTK